ncbi:hypothetical protein [Pseudoclavibacter helvolus]|uniref:hypothetical protein n=1 Tax=Pseudoclavibacter helvolus TaxID=255205 RepID=UPI0012E8F616|nr:hypothetical protein [Pseudoclavibacter helvolus]
MAYPYSATAAHELTAWLEPLVPVVGGALPILIGLGCILALVRLHHVSRRNNSTAWRQRADTAIELFSSRTATGQRLGLSMMEHLATDRRATARDVSLANDLLTEWRR